MLTLCPCHTAERVTAGCHGLCGDKKHSCLHDMVKALTRPSGTLGVPAKPEGQGDARPALVGWALLGVTWAGLFWGGSSAFPKSSQGSQGQAPLWLWDWLR